MHWLVLKTRHKAKQQKDRSNSSQFNLIAHLISWHFGTTIRLFIPTVPASLEHWRRLCKVIPQSQSKVGGFSVSWQGLMHSNQRTDKFSRITNFHFSFFFFFYTLHKVHDPFLFFLSRNGHTSRSVYFTCPVRLWECDCFPVLSWTEGTNNKLCLDKENASMHAPHPM